MSDGTLLKEALARSVDFQDKVLVLMLSDKLFSDSDSSELIAAMEEASIIAALGIRLVIVCDAQSQTEYELRSKGIVIVTVDGIKVMKPAAIEIMAEVYDKMRERISQIFSEFKHRPHLSWPQNAFVAEARAELFGMTGKVDSVDVSSLMHVEIEHPYAPTIHLVRTLGKGVDGQMYMVDADEVAAAIAINLPNSEMVYLGDGAVFENHDIVRQVTVTGARDLLERNVAVGGMAVKLNEAINACEHGVKKVHIVGNRSGELFLSLFTSESPGTIVKPD